MNDCERSFPQYPPSVVNTASTPTATGNPRRLATLLTDTLASLKDHEEVVSSYGLSLERSTSMASQTLQRYPLPSDLFSVLTVNLRDTLRYANAVAKEREARIEMISIVQRMARVLQASPDTPRERQVQPHAAGSSSTHLSPVSLPDNGDRLSDIVDRQSPVEDAQYQAPSTASGELDRQPNRPETDDACSSPHADNPASDSPCKAESTIPKKEDSLSSVLWSKVHLCNADRTGSEHG